MRPAAAHRRPNSLATLRTPRFVVLWVPLVVFLAYRACSHLQLLSNPAPPLVLAPHKSAALARALAARVRSLEADGLARGDLRLALLRAFSPTVAMPAAESSDASRGVDAAVQALLWDISLAQPVVECAWDASLPVRPLAERQGAQVSPPLIYIDDDLSTRETVVFNYTSLPFQDGDLLYNFSPCAKGHRKDQLPGHITCKKAFNREAWSSAYEGCGLLLGAACGKCARQRGAAAALHPAASPSAGRAAARHRVPVHLRERQLRRVRCNRPVGSQTHFCVFAGSLVRL